MKKLNVLVIVIVGILVKERHGQASFDCSPQYCFYEDFPMEEINLEWDYCCASLACQRGVLNDGSKYRDCCPNFCQKLESTYGDESCECQYWGDDIFWKGTTWHADLVDQN